MIEVRMSGQLDLIIDLSNYPTIPEITLKQIPYAPPPPDFVPVNPLAVSGVPINV